MQTMSEKDRGREPTQADYIRAAAAAIDRVVHYPEEAHVPGEVISLGWDEYGVWHERTLDFQQPDPNTEATDRYPRYIKTDGERREGYALWHDEEVWHLPPFGGPHRGGRITRRSMRAELEWLLHAIRHKPNYAHLSIFRPTPGVG